MKLVITSSAPDIQAKIDPRFGRCAFFIFIDNDSNHDETPEWKAVENPAKNSSGGAGIQAAQFIADQGAQAVISGNFGPNAIRTLEAADITSYLFNADDLSVLEIFSQFKAGTIKQK